MTPKHVVRAILITALVYVAAILAFILLGASQQVALFFGGSTALMALAFLMITRGVVEMMQGEGALAEGGLFRLISDPFLVLVPGGVSDQAKALLSAGILYFTKVFVFGDVALGLPPLWFAMFGG